MQRLQVVEMTGTSHKSTAAFCFNSGEKEADYAWAVNRITSIFAPDRLPVVLTIRAQTNQFQHFGK